MSSVNIGWLFYKDYFNDLNYADLSSPQNETKVGNKVKAVMGAKFVSTEHTILGSTRFQGTTEYPGMILGSGNAHELPSVKGQAILGFQFDYTSGLPVIPGSSIKGVLRSAFKHPEYIQELLGDESIDIASLEADIFDNADVFYDANIIKADVYDRILSDDYLTPHSDPLKDPIPLRFIKVLPDVTFLFEFELSGKGMLSKPDKEKLFRDILEDLGLGAKTNVGYGKLTTGKAPKTAIEEEEEKREHLKRVALEEQKRENKLEEERLAKQKANEEKELRMAEEKAKKEEEDKKLLEKLAGQGLSSLIENCTKYNDLERVVKKYLEATALNEEDKTALKVHIQTKIKEKIKRRRFPFGTFGNENCLGKEEANNLADTLIFK